MPALPPIHPDQPPDDMAFVGRGLVVGITTGDVPRDTPRITQEQKGLVTRYDAVTGADTLSREVVDRVVEELNARYETDIQVVWNAVPADLQA